MLFLLFLKYPYVSAYFVLFIFAIAPLASFEILNLLSRQLVITVIIIIYFILVLNVHSFICYSYSYIYY